MQTNNLVYNLIKKIKLKFVARRILDKTQTRRLKKLEPYHYQLI